MSTASERTIEALEHIVKNVPIGTNLALLHLMWAMLSGAFLNSRGAVFPALRWAGFTVSQVRRGGQALRCGVWDITQLIQSWRDYVLSQDAWEPNGYAGYRPLAVDVTAFWRPRLKGWAGKFFHAIANRALKGIGLGLIVQVGQVDNHRLSLVKRIICAQEGELSENQFKQQVLQVAGACLDEHEVLVHDAKASIKDLQTAEIERYVVRLARNCTARRNQLPPRQAQGRPPEYGTLIRPLPRTWKDHTLPASLPEVTQHFHFQGRTIRVHGWRNVVRADQKVDPDHVTFSVWVFFDPLYHHPLVLGTNLTAQPETIFRLYLDRWPVEQVPLVAKQLLGLERQFVFAPAARQRLPALGLLAANIITYLAAVLPPLPTGFWDRQPSRTPGRLRRVLAQTGFPKDYPLDERLRRKQSVTAHLPTGIDAHRRQKIAA